MSDYLTRTIETYDNGVERFENSTKGTSVENGLRRFASMLPENAPPQRVLDAGCAFGKDTANMAALGLEAVGIDLSAKFIERARVLHPDIDFRQADVRDLRQFDDASFDGIWCNATLLHLTDNDVLKSLKGFHRILRNKGVIFISFKEGTGQEEIVEKFSSDGVRFYRYQTVDSVGRMVQDSGFEIIDNQSVNEQDFVSNTSRNLRWILCFARKI